MTEKYAAVKEDEYPVIDEDVSAENPARIFETEFDDVDSGSGKQNDFISLIPLDATENWFKTYWRPAIAWQYLMVCLFDFIIGPVMTVSYYYYTGVEGYTQWSPLTLQATGFYHIAMGAVLGITAYTRSQEKKSIT